MARIINDSDSTLSLEAQQALQQAAANVGGVEVINLCRTNQYENGDLFAVEMLGEADEDGQRENLLSCQFDTESNLVY